VVRVGAERVGAEDRGAALGALRVPPEGGLTADPPDLGAVALGALTVGALEGALAVGAREGARAVGALRDGALADGALMV